MTYLAMGEKQEIWQGFRDALRQGHYHGNQGGGSSKSVLLHSSIKVLQESVNQKYTVEWFIRYGVYRPSHSYR